MAKKLGWLLLGALIALTAIELGLRALPTPTATRLGQYVDPFVTTYPPAFEFRSATGWSLLNSVNHTTNEHGFVAGQRFIPTAAALGLIGDSLVEQSMLPLEERLASAIEVLRDNKPVYAMGIPGSSLFDYLERLRYAHSTLGIRDFWIVVERADVKQSLCGSAAYTDACLDRSGHVVRVRRRERSTLHEIAARSATVQYFVGVLRLSPARWREILFGRTPPEQPDISRRGFTKPGMVTTDERMVIRSFVGELVVLAPRVQIGLIIDPRVGSLRRSVEFADASLAELYATATAAGLAVAHPFAALRKEVLASRLDMRVGPYDAHWNARANRIIAREALRTLPTPAQGRDDH